MQNLNIIVRSAAAAALATSFVSLTACSGSGSSTPLPTVNSPSTLLQQPNGLQTASQDVVTKPKLLFVADQDGNTIYVFNAASTIQNPPPIRKITAGLAAPEGITTDKAGNLYVANGFNSSVTVYAPGASKPKLTLDNGLDAPVDVKVDGFGNVYVANNPGGSTNSYIVEYAKGSNSPETTWFVPQNNMFIGGIALLNPTTAPSIYATAYTGFPASGSILACFPGQSTCNAVGGGSALGQTGGIAVTESPGLSNPFEYLVVDQYVPGFDVFEPAIQQSPIQQINTGGTPQFIAVNAAKSAVFVSDSFNRQVDEYTFPGMQLKNHFPTNGAELIDGVATSPAGTYF